MESASTEIVGSIHAISQVSELLLRLGKKCHVLIKGISGTYWEIDEFGRMFSTFSDSLYLFNSEVHELRSQNCPITQEHRIQHLVSDVLKLSKSKIPPIKDALRQLQALRDDESLTSLVKAKIKWAVRDRQSLRKLLISIEPVRLHILQLAKVFRLHLCYSEIQNLRSELKCVPVQLTTQLQTLNRWNKRLRRECQVASRRYEEHCASASFTPLETKYSFQNDSFDEFMKNVQEITYVEYTVSRDLLAELKETLGGADSETTSVSNGDLDSLCSSKAASLRSGIDHTHSYRRCTDSKMTRSSIARSRISCLSTVSLSMVSVSTSQSCIQRDELTKSTRETSHRHTRTSKPDALPTSHRANLKETQSNDMPAPLTTDALHQSNYQTESMPHTPLEANDTPPEPYPDQTGPIEGTQNWFQIDQNGTFSIDRIPIRNTSTINEPLLDHEEKEDSENDDAASSSFAPSSMYNCLSTSSISVEYHRDNRPQAPPIFISESQSVAPSDTLSISSWEDWAESEIATEISALSVVPDGGIHRDTHCDEVGDGIRMSGWCQDLAHAIFRIEAERVSGRCPCEECMETHQLQRPGEHRRGVPLLM